MFFKLCTRFQFILLLSSGIAPIAHAQSQTDRHLEIEYSHASLTNGFSDWNDVNVLNYFGWKEERFIIETDFKDHFDASAAAIGANWTHVYDPLWYQDFSLSYATDDSILPGLGAFTEIHRKFLSDQSLVGGLGVGHNINSSPYSDTYALLQADYYLGGPISFGIGTRLNNSSPGGVFTSRYFGSVDFLYDRWDGYVRFEFGREGYTVVGDNSFRNEFSSHDTTLVGHYWFGKMGVGARLDFYEGDVYNRNEVALQWLMKY